MDSRDAFKDFMRNGDEEMFGENMRYGIYWYLIFVSNGVCWTVEVLSYSMCEYEIMKNVCVFVYVCIGCLVVWL